MQRLVGMKLLLVLGFAALAWAQVSMQQLLGGVVETSVDWAASIDPAAHTP